MMCLICGWIYDEAEGAPEDGFQPERSGKRAAELDLPGLRRAQGRLEMIEV